MQSTPQTVVTPGVTVVPTSQMVTVVTNQQQPVVNSHVCENYSTQQAYVLGIMQVSKERVQRINWNYYYLKDTIWLGN